MNNAVLDDTTAGRATEPGNERVLRYSHGPAPVEFEAVEPWPEAVNGAELLDTLLRELRRFVVFSKWAGELFALWILHSASGIMAGEDSPWGVGEQ